MHHFDLLESHDRLAVTAVSEVRPPAGVRQRPARADAARAARLPPPHRLRRPSPTRSGASRPGTSAAAGTDSERAHELMEAVRAELVYEPGATDVQTRAEEVLALGRGVCQDFAHVLLAACRSVGIPARYVSGYLYDPTLAGRPRRLARLGRRLGRGARLARARPHPRPRPDRRLRPRRRRARLRRRAAHPRRLQGLGERDPVRARRPAVALSRAQALEVRRGRAAPRASRTGRPGDRAADSCARARPASFRRAARTRISLRRPTSSPASSWWPTKSTRPPRIVSMPS